MTAWFNMNTLFYSQDYLQSNTGPNSAKIYKEGLTQHLAYGFITGSVCWWIWNQARGIN